MMILGGTVMLVTEMGTLQEAPGDVKKLCQRKVTHHNQAALYLFHPLFGQRMSIS